MYIGNALYGQYAAVFAQLYIGDICKGETLNQTDLGSDPFERI